MKKLMNEGSHDVSGALFACLNGVTNGYPCF